MRVVIVAVDPTTTFQMYNRMSEDEVLLPNDLSVATRLVEGGVDHLYVGCDHFGLANKLPSFYAEKEGLFWLACEIFPRFPRLKERTTLIGNAQQLEMLGQRLGARISFLSPFSHSLRLFSATPAFA